MLEGGISFGFGILVAIMFLAYGLWEWRPERDLRETKKP